MKKQRSNPRGGLALKSAFVAPPPVFFRLPKNGRVDPYFGGTRTFWNERVLPSQRNDFCPPVKSRVIKSRPGAKTGIRFIDFRSALAWFEAQDPDSPSHDLGPGALAA